MKIFALITSQIQFEEVKSLSECTSFDFQTICGCCGEITEISRIQKYHGYRAPKPTPKRQIVLFRKLSKTFRDLHSRDVKFTLIVFQDVGRLENLSIQLARKFHGRVVLVPDGIILFFEKVYMEKYPKYVVHFLTSKFLKYKISRKRKWFDSRPDTVVFSPLQELPKGKLAGTKFETIETPRRAAILRNSGEAVARGGMLICGTPLGELGKSRSVWASETEKFIRASRILGENLGATKYSFRPHPGQVKDLLEYGLTEIPVSFQSLSQDLMQNELVVTYLSTLAIEALSVGRDVYIYLPEIENVRKPGLSFELVKTEHKDFWKCVSHSHIIKGPSEITNLATVQEAWRKVFSASE